jgi:menaquinone-dependent protoporphyrinogen IX oxidase
MRGKAGIISFSGFTRRYAEWIAEDTGLTICDLKEIEKDDLKSDFLLIGVPIHSQELCGIKKIRKILREKSSDTRIILFATGLRCGDEKVKESILKYNFREQRPDAFFYFTGGLDQDRLTANDKILLKLQQMMIGRHPDRTESDLELLRKLRSGGDFTDRDEVQPLIDYLKLL